MRGSADAEGDRRQPVEIKHERFFLEALLESLDTGIVACDSAGRLNLLNRAAREIYQAEAGLIGSDQWGEVLQFYREDGRPVLPDDQVPLARALRGEVVRGQVISAHRPGRASRSLVVDAEPIDSADGRRLGAVAAVHDVTEQRRAERLHRAQLAVTRALAEAASVDEATGGVVAAIVGTLTWRCGQFWQVDPDQGAIRPGNTYRAGGFDLREDAMKPLAEQVWRRGTELWTDSMQSGSGASVGVPVRSGDRVLGVLTFATGGRPLYDDGTAAMLDAACAHTGRFIERRHTEDLTLALAAARRDFARVVDRVNDYVWTVELAPEGVVRPVFASPDGSGVFGAVLPAGADLPAEFGARMHRGDLPALAAFREALSAEKPAELECRIHGYDGITRWVWTRGIPRREGGRLFADGISTDVTDRHRLAEQQRAAVRSAQEAEQLLGAVVAVSRRIRQGEDARAAIVSAIEQMGAADYAGLIEPDRIGSPTALVVTAALGALPVGTRIPLDQTSVAADVFRSARPAFVPDTAGHPAVSAPLQRLVDAKSVLCQPVVADGEVVAVLAAWWREKTDSLSDHRARAVALLADETALALIHERLIRRLNEMAHTDTLTGLANRRTWQSELPRLMARAGRSRQPLTVAVVDLDHFKRYNDTYGHPAGDGLLRRSADAFVQVLRDGDLIVRWGGEEFVLALVDCAGDHAATVLDRVRIATPDGQTCSIGYATWDGAESAQQLLTRADNALYEAKNAGRDRIRAAGPPS